MTAAAPWRDIRPELSAEPYVFAAGEPPPGVTPFAVIREDEGVTLVLTRADADRAGLDYDYVAARITLRVGSTLTDVGLTALFSRTLADAGISCNVIAVRQRPADDPVDLVQPVLQDGHAHAGRQRGDSARTHAVAGRRSRSTGPPPLIIVG
jgi:hypothetical protein